jgi:hypothetical protein
LTRKEVRARPEEEEVYAEEALKLVVDDADKSNDDIFFKEEESKVFCA